MFPILVLLLVGSVRSRRHPRVRTMSLLRYSHSDCVLSSCGGHVAVYFLRIFLCPVGVGLRRLCLESVGVDLRWIRLKFRLALVVVGVFAKMVLSIYVFFVGDECYSSVMTHWDDDIPTINCNKVCLAPVKEGQCLWRTFSLFQWLQSSLGGPLTWL